MIEIIKHGSKKRATCQNCGCEMTYEKSDVHNVQTGMNEYDYEITCPDCGEPVKVSYYK